MLASQISAILNNYGFTTGTWTTLYSSTANIHLGAIGLIGDNNLVVNPTHIQFYFDNSNGFLYYRTYAGKPKTSRTNNDEYEVTYEGTKYYVRPLNANIKINGVGNVSGVIDYQEIASFLSYNTSVAKQY